MSDDDSAPRGEACSFCQITGKRTDDQHKLILDAGVLFDEGTIHHAFGLAIVTLQSASPTGKLTQTEALGAFARVAGYAFTKITRAYAEAMMERDKLTDSRLMDVTMGEALALEAHIAKCGALMATAGFAQISCEHGFDSACETFPDLKDRTDLNVS